MTSLLVVLFLRPISVTQVKIVDAEANYKMGLLLTPLLISQAALTLGVL